MDFNKISEHTILHIVTAIAAFSVAVATRFICIKSGCDTGTANLVFIIVLGIGVILYLILIKTIIFQFEKLIARQKKKKAKDIVIESNSISSEESVHDQIVRGRFEKSIAIFQEYTQQSFGRYISSDEIKKLYTYIELFAKEQPLENIIPVQISKRQISNNDLYHFGWNMWSHFKNHRQDQTQECVVAWLKVVFANLIDVEFSTIKGKLKIFDSKSKISIQENISDYLRFLKE
jgi:hypothetical protein